MLGDPEKRKQYDEGSGPFAQGGPGAGFGGFGNFDFDALLDGRHPLQPLRRERGRRGRSQTWPRQARAAERGADLEAQVSITFDQAVAGAQVPLQVPMSDRLRDLPRDRRRARHLADHLPPLRRPGHRDAGPGDVLHLPAVLAVRRVGDDHRESLPDLRGRGDRQDVKRLRVNIPAGVRDGSRIRLAGKGEPGLRGGPPGDLYLITRVTPSQVFKRKGDNLEVEVPLSIPEALLGAEVEVPTLTGTKTLRVKPGTAHGTVQRLRGEGPPKLGSSPPKKGDIHYRFVIEVPKKLDDEQEKAVEELSRTLGSSDPRAGLFANGAGPAPAGGCGERERGLSS